MSTEVNDFNYREDYENSQTKYNMNTTNIDQYLDSITNQDQLLLIQNVVNCFKDPREEIKQVGEQLMKQLEQRVKQQNQNQNQNAYEEQKESLKEPILYKKMGVSILSLDGSFILTDKETTQMLEWQFNKNKQKDYKTLALMLVELTYISKSRARINYLQQMKTKNYQNDNLFRINEKEGYEMAEYKMVREDTNRSYKRIPKRDLRFQQI